MKLRIISVIVAFAALVGFGIATASSASAAPATKPTSALATISVYNQSGGEIGSAVKYAIRQWNKANNVELVQVNSLCSGPLCIIVESVDAHYPGTCGNTMGGCEWTDASGRIRVTVTNNLDAVNRDLEKGVITHEIGHGLGLPHRDPAVDPLTIMGSMISASDPTTVPSFGDIALVDVYWADGYEAPAA